MKTTLALLAAIFLIASCEDPNSKVVARNIKEIEGTVHNSLPIKWDIGNPGGTWQDSFDSDPKGYNPFTFLDGSYLVAIGPMQESFFDYETSTREWKGVIFDTFKIDADEEKNALSVTAHLRNGLKWSDGIEVSSDDLVFWYDQLIGDKEIDPRDYEGQFLTFEDGSKKRITLEKLDKSTVRWVFPRVVANPLLVINDGSLVPKHIWEPVKQQGGVKAVREFWGINTPPSELVGLGPFLLESYTPGERLTFKRNPNYWQKDEAGNQLPYIEKIIATYVPDPNAELLKFQNGELDSYGLRGKDLATLLPEAKSKKYSIWNGGAAGAYTSIIFNQNPKTVDSEKLELFKDKRFHYLISSMIDRETIISQIINGLAEPQFHVVSEFNQYFDPKFTSPYSFNIEKAKTLINELGLEDKNKDGYLDFKSGKTIEFNLMTGSPDPTVHQIINIIASDLKKIGIKVNLQVVDPQAYSDKLLANFDWESVLIGQTFPVFPEQYQNIWPSKGDRHFWNPKQTSPSTDWEKKIDELYNSIEITFNPKKVKEIYSEFQKTLLDELVIIPMYRKYVFTAVYDKWGNINWDAQHSVGDSLVRTYLKK